MVKKQTSFHTETSKKEKDKARINNKHLTSQK